MKIISLRIAFLDLGIKPFKRKYMHINRTSQCIFYRYFGESIVIAFIWNVRINITYQMFVGKHYFRY